MKKLVDMLCTQAFFIYALALNVLCVKAQNIPDYANIPYYPQPQLVTVNANCDFLVIGPSSICNATPTTTYTIAPSFTPIDFTGFNITYTPAILNTNGSNNSVTQVGSTNFGQFTVNFPNTFNHYYITITYSDPQTSCFTYKIFEVTPCCQNPADFISNGTASTLPFTGADPFNAGALFAGAQTYALSGTFVVDQDITLAGCSLLMAPGSEIIVNTGKKLTLKKLPATVNPILQAACDIMWKGITVQDGGKLSISGVDAGADYGAAIRDAQYAINFLGDAQYEVFGNVYLERNYVGLYAKPVYPNEHFLTPLNNNLNQAFSVWGSNEGNGASYIHPSLFPPFTGQLPLPINNQSLAGCLVHDVNNFSFFNDNAIIGDAHVHLSNNEYGVRAHNSNLDLKYFNIEYCKAEPSGAKHSGTGILALGLPNNSPQKTLQLDGMTLGSPDPLGLIYYTQFNWCNTSVFVNNMNAEINNVSFNNCPYPNNYTTGCYWAFNPNSSFNTNNHIVAGGNGSTIEITNNAFQFSAISIRIAGRTAADVTIESNYFASPRILPDNSFNNSCMYLSGLPGISSNSGNFIITNNTFDKMRIGLYMNNVNPETCDISLNHYYIDAGVYDHALGWPLYNQNHIGYWFDKCSGLNLKDNEAINTSLAPSTNLASYASKAIAFNIKTVSTGVNNKLTDIRQNNIKDMGTAFRFVDRCIPVQLYCNGMEHCRRGVFYDYSENSTQGIASAPWGNEWQNWTIANNGLRVQGNWLGVPQSPVRWYYDQGNASLQRPFPFSVNPINYFLDQATVGVAPCSAPRPGNAEYPDLIDAIINEEMDYTIYPDECDERDREYVYQRMRYNAMLRNSSAEFQEFYDQYINSNFEKFEDVNALAVAVDYGSALQMLNAIVPESNLQSNMKYALTIAIRQQAESGYEINQQDQTDLLLLANTPVWAGGDAVFIARLLMNVEINDYANGLRMEGDEGSDETVACSIYPNPTKGIVYIKAEGITEYAIEITDVFGRIINTITSHIEQTRVDISALKNGFYFISIKKGNSIVEQQKISKQ